MKRILSIFLGCALLWGTAQASVKDVKWGVDAQHNLRLVVDLTEPADFVTSVENQTLVIRVKSALEGESRTVEIASEFTKSMNIKAAGAETVVRVPLTRPIAKEDIKTFTLKQDPVTKRPSRIVFDLQKQQPVLPNVNTLKTEPPKVVSEPVKPVAAEPTKTVLKQPKITVGSGSATAGAIKTNPNVNPKLIPASVVNSKGVQLADTKQIAKIPEIRRTQAAVSQSKTPSVGSMPVQSGAPAPIKVKIPPADCNGSGSVQKAVSPGISTTTIQIPKVMVGGDASKTSTVSENKSKKIKENKKGEYRTGGGIKGKVITIDPGHGGSDPGAVSSKGTYEKTITLSMAKKLKADLEKMGATVYMTRSTDVDVAGKDADDEKELQARVDVAEKHRSDLFISLHINASVNKKAAGISTYYFAKNKFDSKLANCIHKQLTANFGLNDMGVRQANFYVIKRCYMPAVLMELGFITNAKEEKTIKGNWFQNKAMDLISKGIRDYFK